MIHVCSLARLSDTVKQHRVRYVVSLLANRDRVFRPEGIEADDHLWLGMDDIADVIEGMTPPGEAHVAKLIAFLDRYLKAD